MANQTSKQGHDDFESQANVTCDSREREDGQRDFWVLVIDLERSLGSIGCGCP